MQVSFTGGHIQRLPVVRIRTGDPSTGARRGRIILGYPIQNRWKDGSGLKT
jgi:hypothetical protein